MTAPLEVPVLIGRKRDGGTLSADEWDALLTGYLRGEVDEAQIAALLMAGVINGFSDDEAVALTDVLLRSGDTIDLSRLSGPTVDKHSTGGVGDTTTLVVAPLLAACGAQVAKLSGRGLGHTGGTLDKLEAIPGFRVDLTPDEVIGQVRRCGLAVAAATADLVPLDKRLYALRDVTGTVAAQALIASSVMSKKLAGGAGHVLLDVKTGDGAFLTDPDQAAALARLCVRIGTAHGRRTGALVTDMSQPLGDAVGNALEVRHAIEVLQGEAPGRLEKLSVALTAAALELTGVPADEADERVRAALDDGSGLARLRDLVAAQGGDPEVTEHPRDVLPAAPVVERWRPGVATVTGFACRRLGELAARLGAGRQRAGDTVDPAVGLEVHVRTGDRLDDGDAAVTVHARREEDAAAVCAELAAAVHLSTDDVTVTGPELVHARLGV